MATLFVYSVFSSISLAMLWGVWAISLKRANLATFNRKVLLAIYAVSLVILPLSKFVEGHSNANISIEIEHPTVAAIAQPDVISDPAWISLIRSIVVIYSVVAILILIYFLYGAIRLLILRHHSKATILPSGERVRITDSENTSPFSFMGEIYIPQSTTGGEDGGMLLLHESAHVNRCHWVDLLISHTVCAFQWYNPAAWKMRADIRRIHEYEADADVIRSGVDAHKYQLLLLRHAITPAYLSITDNFNQSSLKSRILMMYKPANSPKHRLRALALIPFAGIAFFATMLPAANAVATEVSVTYNYIESAPAHEKAADNPDAVKSPEVSDGNAEIFYEVEVIPEYPGGINALMKFLSENIRYPENAKNANIQGRVVIQFVVSANGKVTDPHVLRGVSHELDAEALRVVQLLPDFTPGYVDGKPVACHFTLPVNFKLQSDAKDAAAAPAIFVDGKLYAGSSSDINPETIERIDMIKNDPEYPDGKVMITLKK